MPPPRAAVAQSLRQLRPRLPVQQRRYAGDTQGAHHKHEAHGGPNQHPTNENFGSGFYITLAAIPASIALYTYASQRTDEEQPWLTRVISNIYEDYAHKWARRNDLHVQAMEQAAADKVLFLNESNQSIRRVEVRYPEQFNHGSPWNVPAGHGSANLDQVIAKYEREAYEENERKLQQLRENKVPIEQPTPPLIKMPPATPPGA